MGNIEKWRDCLTAGTVSPVQQEAANAIAHALGTLEVNPDGWGQAAKTDLKDIVDELASNMEELLTADEPAPEGRHSLDMGLELTKANGVVIPMHLSISYPEDEGMWALRALDNLSDYTSSLFPELIRRGDVSVVTALAQYKAEEEREQIADTLGGGEQ